MKNTHIAILGLACSSLWSGTLFAQESTRPSLNFVELKYVYASADVNFEQLPDNANSNWYLNGAELDASFALDDKFLFRGSYYLSDGDEPDKGTNYNTAVLGFGILNPSTDAVSLDASVEYRFDTLEYGSSDKSLSGLGFGFGIRANVAEKHELGARFAMYTGDYDKSPYIQVNYAWNFAENFALTAGWDYFNLTSSDSSKDNDVDLTRLTLGGRFYF